MYIYISYVNCIKLVCCLGIPSTFIKKILLSYEIFFVIPVHVCVNTCDVYMHDLLIILLTILILQLINVKIFMF